MGVEEMERDRKIRTVAAAAVLLSILGALGLAGEADRIDAIIYSMDSIEYHHIKDSLEAKGLPSDDGAIADAFINKTHY